MKLRAKEHAVVEEFAGVIRKHRDQGLVALARLARVAFEFSVGARASRQDKLALALARGLEARQRLAQAEGGSLSSDEVARLLGISKTAVLKRLEGRAIARMARSTPASRTISVLAVRLARPNLGGLGGGARSPQPGRAPGCLGENPLLFADKAQPG